MPRSIWKGSISFGLVNVPVKLYSAVSKKAVRFNQLHAQDSGRIQMKRFCAKHEAEVPYEEIVKGFEVGPDRYVVITQDELDALAPEKTRTIDIEDFVDRAQIDPVYFDHPYYLAPDTGAAKAYRLLLDALRETGKVAIARVVIRQKEYLTAIRPAGDVLAMETMVFADEVVDPGQIDEIPDGKARTTDREAEMARQLIESQATNFDPGRYRDEYRERMMELIERKAAGEQVEVAATPAPAAPVPDLMEALEASLAASKQAREKAQAKVGAKAGAKAKPSAKAKVPARAKSPAKPESPAKAKAPAKATRAAKPTKPAKPAEAAKPTKPARAAKPR